MPPSYDAGGFRASLYYARLSKSVKLENRAALEAAGIRIRLHDSGLTDTWTVLAGDIEESALTTGYRHALALPDSDAWLWRRAVRWLWKANGDPDPYDQFLALWISFNVLYGRYHTGRETLAIENYLLHAVPAESDADEFLAEMAVENIGLLAESGLSLGRTGTRPIAEEIRTAAALPPERWRRLEFLTLIVLGLYAVRCAVVHKGGVELPRDNEIRLVWASVHIMKPVLMRLLRRRLGVDIAAELRRT